MVEGRDRVADEPRDLVVEPVQRVHQSSLVSGAAAEAEDAMRRVAAREEFRQLHDLTLALASRRYRSYLAQPH